MIRAWKSANWAVRTVMLLCAYIIVDSVSSLTFLWLAETRGGDPLDRFTVSRVERLNGKAAVIYKYHHANSSADLTAVYLADGAIPAVGDVSYRSPGGTQVLLSNLGPADVAIRWGGSGKPSVPLPADVLRERDWNQRQACLFKLRNGRRVCWDATHIDVE